MNRCINHILGYCNDKPQPVETPGTEVTFDYRGQPHYQAITGTQCLNNWRTCSQYLSHTQAYALKTE